jgi:hypothetical protein
VDKALEMPCNTWILHSTTRPTICIIQGKAQKYRNYRRHHDEHQLAIGHTHENTPHEIRKARNQRKDTNHTTTTQLCTLGPICNLIFFQLSSDLDKHHRISRNQHKSHTSSHFNSGRKNTWSNLTVLTTTRPLDSWIPMLSTPGSKITPDGRHEALTSSPIYIAHSTHTDLDLRILEQKHERTPHRNW